VVLKKKNISTQIFFLSSIEIVVFEIADVFMMQNWSHVIHIMENLNRKPAKLSSITTDLSRVRKWAIDDLAGFYRQTIVFSRLDAPELRGLFSKFCQNFDGYITALVLKSTLNTPIMQSLTMTAPQAYHRFNVPALEDDADCRFEFFKQKIFPDLKNSSLLRRVVIFASSYLDFVRLRNLFRNPDEGGLNLSFVQLSEYAEDKKISRARDLFYHAKKRVALVTERFHFYKRYRLRGVRHIIFYQLPLYAKFYNEVCEWTMWSEHDESVLADPDDVPPTCTVLYSKYDSLKLADILGNEEASRLINSDKNVHIVQLKD